MNVDVLIVGAGPTGLMLANQLGRRGVKAMIIDRHGGPAMQSRAMAVQARTLEIYAKLGVADQAVALGAPGNGANMWVHGQRRARIPLKEIGEGLSPFPYVLMLGQDDNERILGAHLRHWHMDVQWNTELVALVQHREHVIATIKGPDGRERVVHASYVAGCDGGRSAVREMNGIGFPGAPYDHVFFVADTEATGPMVPNELNVYLYRDGFNLFFPMRQRNGWRVIGILPEDLRNRDGLEFEHLLPWLREETGRALSFRSCHWFSTYRIQHRCTERFRKGRCFLVGDAAHVHSPAGGQGMNTGLQDAYNLAWKLALVVSGRAQDSLLDSYEAERMPVAQRLLDTTDRAFRLIVSKSWIAGVFRTRFVTRLVATAMKRRAARRLAFMTLSQIGIRYPKSPLSRTIAAAPDAPQAGDRFPWVHLAFLPGGPREDVFQKMDDTRFTLLLFGQPAPVDGIPGFRDLVDVRAVAETPENDAALRHLSITGPAYYLVRPDGYVALAGARFHETDVRLWFADQRVHAASLAGISYRSHGAPAVVPLSRVGAGRVGAARRAS
jgi:2-polyprenyl-6-methoxyphenol hydroxylase-like FAD-dependent oxidoreductase